MSDVHAAWRRKYPVLVTDAQERMSLAVIRSLGRAGYPVIACASTPEAAGLYSAFTSARFVCPASDSPDFVDWLRRCVAEEGVACIVPGEAALLTMRPHFAEFRGLLPLSDDEATVYRGINKVELFETLAGTEHLPPTIIVDGDSGLPALAELEQLGTPLFIKADGGHARDGSASQVWRETTADGALCRLAGLHERYTRWLVQGYVPGRGVGAFVLRWDGEVRAEMMHLRLHEIPIEGWSSYRRTTWHAGMMDDARRKLEALDWQGVAMMEYRWDEHRDEFALLEMNGRFWGSLHLALYAGVDFPVRLVDAFFGRPSPLVRATSSDVRSRNLILEVRYVMSRLRDRSLSLRVRLASVVEFFALMLHPRVKSDVLFPGDRRLFVRQLGHYLRRAIGSRS